MKPPVMFVAQVGRRRAFLSAADKLAYEEGWSEHEEGIPYTGPLNTPKSQGWFDAEKRELDRSVTYGASA